MNGTNFCNGLTVTPVSFMFPFKEIYEKQRAFQLLVKSLDLTDNLATSAAHKCIYWSHCVADERKELIDWFDPEFNKDGLTVDQILQEIQMEAIDIFHFVMNMGLELRFTSEEIQAIADDCNFDVHVPVLHVCEDICKALCDAVVKLIGGLPWKTWKTYDPFTIEDVKDLIRDDYVKVYRLSLGLCSKVDLTKDDVVNVYCAKNLENINRQANGY